MRDNAAWMPKDIVTVIDVLEDGACISGVVDVIKRTRVIAGPPVDTRSTEGRLMKAARNNGNGDGDGYGYGDGDGDGYGDGYGYGSGDGDGYGDGYGSGDGYGYG